MSASTALAPEETRDSAVRRIAYAVLATAVRGRRPRGGDWGEAVLAEFGETRGGWEAVRWTAGGMRAVWHERRGQFQRLPRYLRISSRVAVIAMVGLIAGLAVNRWVITVSSVDVASMEPSMESGDRILQDKLGFRFTGLDRGDVVVYSRKDGMTDIQRVIGLPGDTVACHDGTVWRDGEPLSEPYLGDDAGTECTTVVVPPGQVYLLRDFRLADVGDSRQVGPISQDRIRSRAVTRVWDATQ